MNTIELIQQKIHASIQDLYKLTPDILTQITVSLITDPAKSEFADISTNAALVLAKVLNKNPRQIATELTEAMQQIQDDSMESISIAGAGFINIVLKVDAFKRTLEEFLALRDQFFKPDLNTSHLSYSIEFVSANPTGPLHLGHGRGGIIGDVLGNVLRFLGNTVTKEFYINDAGSQIKKLGHSFKVRCLQATGQNAALPEDGYQGQYLVDLAEVLIQQEGAAVLDKPDAFFEEYAKNALLQNVRTTLTRYGIEFDVWFSEKSLYDDGSIERAIELLKKRGYTYEADGALWFTSTTFGDDKDRVLRKSNGEYTYATSDVAYIHNKIARGADRLIFILGQDHHSYVIRLKAIMEALGYVPAYLDVILYQLVTLKETGQQIRMSKRAGRIVSLEDVIETVGTDISRFFYLHRKADAHLDFDIDLALKHTDENPVYYAQYAYVRIGSIIEKSLQYPELENLTNADAAGLGVEEKLLLKKILSLKELLKNISSNYQTHLLTYYILELAHLFHRYYNDHRVIERENPTKSRARLLLITLLRSTLELCFKLLEISTPQKM